MITMTQPSLFTALDHPDFKLNEQQEAVIDFFVEGSRFNPLFLKYDGWFTAYDLYGQNGYVRDKRVRIGDAGRRMRELRAKGILESRKRGKYEEFRIIN